MYFAHQSLYSSTLLNFTKSQKHGDGHQQNGNWNEQKVNCHQQNGNCHKQNGNCHEQNGNCHGYICFFYTLVFFIYIDMILILYLGNAQVSQGSAVARVVCFVLLLWQLSRVFWSRWHTYRQ